MDETTEIIDDLISFLCVEIEYIQVCLKSSCKIPIQQLKKNAVAKRFQWTGDKINLVELIYALYFAGCINHGCAKIKDIKEAFEEVFSIDLGEYYRAYVEIKRRKLVQGKFLRSLLNLLEGNIVESDKK